jgi:peptidoglycan hydrolase CwlO-like protein
VENPVQVNKRGPVDELQMLRAQVAALDRVIGRLQAELARRDAAQAQTATELQALQQEVAELRRQLQAQPEPQR